MSLIKALSGLRPRVTANPPQKGSTSLICLQGAQRGSRWDKSHLLPPAHFKMGFRGTFVYYLASCTDISLLYFLRHTTLFSIWLHSPSKGAKSTLFPKRGYHRYQGQCNPNLQQRAVEDVIIGSDVKDKALFCFVTIDRRMTTKSLLDFLPKTKSWPERSYLYLTSLSRLFCLSS